MKTAKETTLKTTTQAGPPRFSERVTITKEEIAYLMKAVGKDECQPDMWYGILFKREGQTWLATTDGHRSHVVRVANHDKWRTEWEIADRSLIDIKRLALELRFRKGKEVFLDGDLVSIQGEQVWEPLFSDPKDFPGLLKLIDRAVAELASETRPSALAARQSQGLNRCS